MQTEQTIDGGESKAVALRAADVGIMRVSTTLAEIVEAKKERDALIKEVFVNGVHFGVIDGTDKPTLYQNGAAEATYWYKCYPEYRILSQQHDPGRTNEYMGFKWSWNPNTRKNEKSRDKVKLTSIGHHAFQMECRLIHRLTGEVVGTGVGACSTAESKYVSRPNDCENTVLKMAKKRAFVDASLITFALGSLFTQDVEDLPAELLTLGRNPKPAAARSAPKAEPKKETFDATSIADLVKAGTIKTTTHKGSTYLWASAIGPIDTNQLEELGFKERADDNGESTGQYVIEATAEIVAKMRALLTAAAA